IDRDRRCNPRYDRGHLWARYAGKKVEHVAAHKEEIIDNAHLPSVVASFLPVIVPIFLIAINSFFAMEKSNNSLQKIFAVLGEPVIALSIGLLLVFITMRNLTKQT